MSRRPTPQEAEDHPEPVQSSAAEDPVMPDQADVRKTSFLCAATASVTGLKYLENTDLAQLQREDPEWGSIAEAVMNNAPLPPLADIQAESPAYKNLYSQRDSLQVHNGVVYRLTPGHTNPQLLLPKAIRAQVVTEIHEKECAHAGLKKTLDQVQRRAYWPSWRTHVTRLVRGSIRCQQYHRGKLPKHGHFSP